MPRWLLAFLSTGSAAERRPGGRREARRLLQTVPGRDPSGCGPWRPRGLGDHRFDHLLDDLSAKARAGWIDTTARRSRRCPGRSSSRSSPAAAKLDYQILQHELTKVPVAGRKHAAASSKTRGSTADTSATASYLLLTQSTSAQGNQRRQRHRPHEADPQGRCRGAGESQNPPQVHTETAIRQNRGAIGFYEEDLFELAGRRRKRMP